MESEPVIDPDSIALPQTHASSDGSPSITGRKKSPPAPLPLDNLQRLAALRRRKPPGSSFKDAGANNRRGSRTFSIVQEDDKDEDRDAVVLDRPLRTDSLDTVASLSASISTLPSTSTGITTPAAIATTFAEPHFYDSSDVYPHRSTSIPIRGIHNLDPLRTASIDSDISLTGTTFYDPFVPRNMRRIKHPTFPIRGPQRQDSIDVPPLPPSSLRRESLPPISPQAPQPPNAEEEHPPRRRSEAGDSDAAPVNSQSSPHTPASSPELSVAIRSVRSQSATVLLEAPAQVPHSDHFPDDSVVEDVCCHILKNVYGKTIDEIDSPGEVWTSVQRCLAELSVIVGTGDEPLMDNPGGPSSAGGNAGGGGNTNPTRKRPNPQEHHDHGNSPDDGEDYNGYGKPPGDGEDDEDDDHGPTKKARTGEEPDFKISCPFRKRNPLRFNVRDHYECAGKSFPTISSLKRHIKIFHKIKQAPGSQLTCSRCHAAMGSREELEAHLQVPREQICAPVPSEPNLYANPEDGINKATELQLNVRKNNTKVDSWEGVWKTLFPHDAEDDIPTPEFHPPIDLEEIHHDFLTSFNEGQPQGRLGLQLLRYPGLNHAIQLDIAANSTAECRDFINEVFATCRQKHGDANGSPPRRRRSNRNPNSSGTTRPPSHEPHSPLRQRGLPALQPPGLGQDLHPITTRGATGMLPQPLQSVPATPVSLPSAGSSHMVSFHGSSNMGFGHSGGPTDFIDFASGQLSPEQQQQQRHRSQPQRPQEHHQHQNQHRQPQFNHAALGMTPGMLPGHPDLPYHLDQRLGPQYQLGGNGMNSAYPTSIEEDLGSGYVAGFESSASLPFLRDNMSYYPTATTVATSHGMMSVPGGSGASLQGTAGGGIPGALLHEDASSGRQSRGSGSRLSSEWSEIQGVPPASGFSTDQPGR